MQAPVADSATGLHAARVAFTGRLATITRGEARRAVEAAGGTVVESLSRRTSLLVVGMDGWPLAGDGTLGRKLRRAEDLNRAGARIRIIPEEDFLELAGLRARRTGLRKSYPAGQVCELVGLDPETLRRWELFGLVRAANGLYDFQDLVSLRTIAELVATGVDPATIRRTIRGLSALLPGTERPLSQLRIVVEQPGSLLAEIDGRLVAPDGQLVLEFGRRPSPGTASRPDPSPEDDLDRARGLEADERLVEAEAAYRRVLARRPDLTEAHFNLGNVLRGQGRLEAAEERFRATLEHDPGLAGAWYNLADLLEETGRIDAAIECLHRAVAADPDFADAHFNLAYCYEQVGRDASEHWRAYLRLDAESEWAAEARRHLPQ